MNTKSTKNELPKEARHDAIALLNRELANTLDLRLRARHALWNLQGSRFGSLQTLCIQVLQANHDASEILASRVMELGGVVEATIQRVQCNSRLEWNSTAATSALEQLWEFCGAFIQYAASVRGAANAADLTGDYDTGDIFTLISRTADRLLWKIGANLCETRGNPALPIAARLNSPVKLVEIPFGGGR